MAVEIRGEYTGELKVRVTHGPSGAVFQTEAPVDNGGTGGSFSPTDLVATALGSCMLTLIGIVAKRDGLDVRGATVRVEKHMNAEPRRIGSLPVEIHLPAGLAAASRQKLENAAHSCPVRKSLAAEIDVPVRFVYPD